MTYSVHGLVDSLDHVDLHNAETRSAAEHWVARYIEVGDWGDYYGIAIIDPSGEWVKTYDAPETDTWSGSPCPDDPDNFWIDDETGERRPA